MALFFIKQPNGLYAVWSTISDDFRRINLSREQAFNLSYREYKERGVYPGGEETLRADVAKALEQVDITGKQGDEGLTWEGAIHLIYHLHGADAETLQQARALGLPTPEPERCPRCDKGYQNVPCLTCGRVVCDDCSSLSFEDYIAAIRELKDKLKARDITGDEMVPVNGCKDCAELAVQIIELKCTCGACPLQYEGRLSNGQYFYFRARWETWEFAVGASVDQAIDTSLYEGRNGLFYAGGDWGDGPFAASWMVSEDGEKLIRETVKTYALLIKQAMDNNQ